MVNDDGGLVEYYSCPLLFIGSSVNDFLTRRAYLEKYPHTAPSFEDQDPRYLAFDRYYTAKVSEFQERMKTTGGVQ